jgi:hypothetical protein
MAANAIQVRIAFIEGPPDILPITLERQGALPQENNVGADSRRWTVRNEIEQYLHDVAMKKASIPMRMVGVPSKPAE